jgi:hypothetical protein
MRTIALVSSLTLASCAFASTPRFTTAYGQTYAEVGDPGNADYTYEVLPGGPTRSIGGVDYRYRIAITEVTNAQWAEFANAISPHLDSIGGWGSDFAPTLSYDGFNPQGDPVFGVVAGAENNPARMGWRWAARYTNWLHNDKALTVEAFQTGAYDTSRFAEGGGTSVRLDGARFWIPSEDEWVKAAYYDPNRFGEGQGGYWQFPGMSDDPLITAPPDEGGESNVGGFWYGGEGSGLVPFDVGSYPNAASSYGVLDASGGESEWTDTIAFSQLNMRLALGGDYTLDAKFHAQVEVIGAYATTIFNGAPWHGFRIAASVPSPGAALLVACVPLLVAGRRR